MTTNSETYTDRSNCNRTVQWTKKPHGQFTKPKDILTPSWQSQDTQQLMANNFSMKPNQPVWQLNKQLWFSHLVRCPVHNRNDCTRIKTHYKCQQSQFQKCRDTVSAGTQYLQSHVLAQNCSQGLVNECTFGEITSSQHATQGCAS